MSARFLAFALLIAFPARAIEVPDAPLMPGAMVIGSAPGHERVEINGVSVRVAENGRFVFGLDRDASGEVRLEAGGQRLSVPVASRDYDIQRIDGLPPSKVNLSPESLKKYRAERSRIGAARAPDSDDLGWQQDFRWPVVGRITGVYGSQRILNGEPRRPHYGIDIAAPAGTPVIAPADGVVRLADPGFVLEGGIVIIDHGHKVNSTIFHLGSILVEEGQMVRQGEQVATVGNTGRSTGAHADWRVKWRDKNLDPALLAGPMPAGGAGE